MPHIGPTKISSDRDPFPSVDACMRESRARRTIRRVTRWTPLAVLLSWMGYQGDVLPFRYTRSFGEVVMHIVPTVAVLFLVFYWLEDDESKQPDAGDDGEIFCRSSKRGSRRRRE